VTAFAFLGWAFRWWFLVLGIFDTGVSQWSFSGSVCASIPHAEFGVGGLVCSSFHRSDSFSYTKKRHHGSWVYDVKKIWSRSAALDGVGLRLVEGRAVFPRVLLRVGNMERRMSVGAGEDIAGCLLRLSRHRGSWIGWLEALVVLFSPFAVSCLGRWLCCPPAAVRLICCLLGSSCLLCLTPNRYRVGLGHWERRLPCVKVPFVRSRSKHGSFACRGLASVFSWMLVKPGADSGVGIGVPCLLWSGERRTWLLGAWVRKSCTLVICGVEFAVPLVRVRAPAPTEPCWCSDAG